MSTIIDFTKLKRVPTSNDIDKAQKQFEIALVKIIQKHKDYFSSNNIPETIEYLINHSLITEFTKLPFPEISISDTGLSEEIKNETALKFYEIFFAVVNT